MPRALLASTFTTKTAFELISPDQLRSSSYQRLLRGVYTTRRQIDHGDRIRAAQLMTSSDAVLGGLSALWAFGVQMAGPDDPVELVLPPHRRRRAQRYLTVRNDQLLVSEIVETAFGAVTTPARTAFDLARRDLPSRTVPQLDALARATGVSVREVLDVLEEHRGERWVRRVPVALELMDAGSESVRESQLRVALMQAGLPRPVTQYTIRNREGQFVARVDMAWPQWRVVVEYDGAHHDHPAQAPRDRARLNALRVVGWSVLVIDRAQFARLTDTVATVRQLLVASGAPL